jgi:ketosteroid isomerase-like protein
MERGSQKPAEGNGHRETALLGLWRDTERAMSEESTTPELVERVRGILDAANGEEWDAILALYALDAVWDTDGMGSFEGPAAIRGFWEDWWGSYEHLEIDVLEIREIGNGVVLAAFHLQGPPKGTTAEAHTYIALVYEWVRGAVARVTTYTDIASARAVAEQLAEERR